MRFAFSSLILAAGLAGAAYAQDPVAPAAPAAAPTQVVEPSPAPAAEPTPTAAAPTLVVEPPPAPAAEPAPPPPTLPTTGDAAEAISALERVCVPAVRGQKLGIVAKAAGFKLNRREETWSKQLGATSKDYRLIIYPQYSNTTVCTFELRYAPGQDVEMAKAFNVWAFLHEPPLDPTANYTQPQDPDGKKRVRRSWEYLAQNQSIGLNFSTVRNTDDSQISPKFDMATMSYQERTLP